MFVNPHLRSRPPHLFRLMMMMMLMLLLMAQTDKKISRVVINTRQQRYQKYK